MSSDELKKRILSRRARFIAAALAGAGIGAAPACGTAQACLFPAGGGFDSGVDADDEAPPQICLTAPQPDAGADADAASDADAAPQPCLVPLEDAGGGGG